MGLPGVEWATTGRAAGLITASVRGPVVRETLPALLDGLAELFADGVPVLLDVSELQLDWAPAPEAFVTAVTAAGGWPLARSVLVGARPAAVERLRSCRVTDSFRSP